MLKSYLKIALRNLLKNRGYSFINIGGLAVGMGVAMLIGLWIYDELSFNHYHQNYGRIAQIVQDQVMDGETKTNKSLPFPFVNELKTNYSEHFQYIVTSSQPGEYVLAAGDKKITKKGQFAEPAAPEMLSLEMLAGSRAGLQDLQSVMLSKSTAEALFGKTNPLNKLVRIDADKNVKVTGVYKDLPQNSQFHELQFLSTWDYYLVTNRYMSQKKWDNHALFIYVQIKPATTFEQANAAIRDAELNAIRHIENMREEYATNPKMWLHPMRDWHLYSTFKNGVADSDPVQYVWVVGMIGFFVLLLACINFMNLSTARSEKRAKEVGIRKAIGSLRGQLIRQFFSESFLVVFLAFIVALTLVVSSLEWFNKLAAKQMSVPWTNVYFWLISLGFIFITGLLAGSYPALYLTSFQPVKVLKGATIQLGKYASLPRKVLVTLQFTVSITLVICTIVIYSQVQFAKKRAVGYSREGLMMISLRTEEFYTRTDLLQTELKNTGVVSQVALSQSPTTGVWSANTGFNWKGDERGTDEFGTLSVSPEYAATVGWEFIAGRNFSKDLASDSAGFVLSETAAKLMGFGGKKIPEAIGETVTWKSKWMTNDIRKPYKIIGVVKDMVMESPFQQTRPTVFLLAGNPNWLNIRLKSTVSPNLALSKIEQLFKRLTPGSPFEYKFADEEYDAKFRAEERLGKLTGFFSFLAILISCLGLFGLASFVAEQRTREIGIRKVLGASVANLWQMLSKDFVLLVLISSVISIPIALFAMHAWLSKYTYHTSISSWIFITTSLGALIVTLATVSYQAIRTALMDPVRTLRGE